MSFEQPQPPWNAADPNASFLNASCFDFLLIELVPLANRMAAELAAAGPGPGPAPGPAPTSTPSVHSTTTTTTAAAAATTSQPPPHASNAAAANAALAAATAAGPATTTATVTTAADDDSQREIISRRLETLGYRVGQGIVERFSRDRPRFTDSLDVIKFLCKDLWTLLFRKQIDNLKTNHRGVYVLTDNAFKPFSRMSMKTSTEAMERAQPFLWFPCGVIRGALASMGINAVVQAETMELPGAVFQIKTIVAKQ